MSTEDPASTLRGRLKRRLTAVAAVITLTLGTAAALTTPARAAANGPLIYLANEAADTVSVYDVGTASVVATIPVGQSPVSVAMAVPGSATAYVVDQGDDTITTPQVP